MATFGIYARSILNAHDYSIPIQNTPKLEKKEGISVKIRCVGSCGEVCPNHDCSAHNGKEFNRSSFDLMRKKKMINL